MKLKNRSGFTLIELLLYIGLAAAILLAVSIFLSVLLQSRVKNQAVAEVEHQGWQVSEVISKNIRNAELINNPTPGATASSLSLQSNEAGKNPTIFNLSGTTFKITEGVSSPISLTSSKVLVSNLNFENLSKADTPGNIRFWFTISHLNPENLKEYNYVKTFYGTASLR